MRARRDPARNADLAAIHIAKKDLGLDDDTYRDMLWAVGRVRSSADLDFAGRKRVLEHLRKAGFNKDRTFHVKPSPEWAWVNTAAEDRKPMLRKIIMQLKSAGRLKEYADGIAAAMFRIERLELCGPHELHAIVTALNKDAKRRAAKEPA